jgi:hypothetical protein
MYHIFAGRSFFGHTLVSPAENLGNSQRHPMPRARNAAANFIGWDGHSKLPRKPTETSGEKCRLSGLLDFGSLVTKVGEIRNRTRSVFVTWKNSFA